MKRDPLAPPRSAAESGRTQQRDAIMEILNEALPAPSNGVEWLLDRLERRGGRA